MERATKTLATARSSLTFCRYRRTKTAGGDLAQPVLRQSRWLAGARSRLDGLLPDRV